MDRVRSAKLSIYAESQQDIWRENGKIDWA
jgi:hypothetical protein